MDSPAPGGGAAGQGTFKIFGDDARGYLHKYSIADSIADETTLPIRYTLAPGDLTVPAEQLDREFLAAADAEGVTEVEELNRVLDRAVHLRTFLTAGDRMRKVAAFVAETLPGAGRSARLQGIPGGREPRGVRTLQAGAGRAAARRVERRGLYRTPRRRPGASPRGALSASAGARAGGPPELQTRGPRPAHPDRSPTSC